MSYRGIRRSVGAVRASIRELERVHGEADVAVALVRQLQQDVPLRVDALAGANLNQNDLRMTGILA